MYIQYGYKHIYFCLLEPLPLLFSYLSNVFEKNSASLSCTEWKGKNRGYLYLLSHLAWVCPIQGSIHAHKQKPLGHRAGWQLEGKKGSGSKWVLRNSFMPTNPFPDTVFFCFFFKELSWHDRRTWMKRYERKWINWQVRTFNTQKRCTKKIVKSCYIFCFYTQCSSNSRGPDSRPSEGLHQ